MRNLILCVAMAISMMSASAAETESRFFEMRTYYAAPGKMENLLARFRSHTTALFEKHGIENIGYWLPLTNTDNKLIYLLSYPSREAREKSWKEFMGDTDWQNAAKESEKDGKLVSKVESVFLKPTDFSPAVKARAAQPARVFELRTYDAEAGKLDALLSRFQDHTVKLFEQHGMENIGYWTPTEAKDGAGKKLIYILAHKSAEACAVSFAAFRKDPEWIKVKAASEANGPLTVTNGVHSVLMAPTDFSVSK